MTCALALLQGNFVELKPKETFFYVVSRSVIVLSFMFRSVSRLSTFLYTVCKYESSPALPAMETSSSSHAVY